MVGMVGMVSMVSMHKKEERLINLIQYSCTPIINRSQDKSD
jgi:hypothetical protein